MVARGEGEVRFSNKPSWLENNRMSLFDNGGRFSKLWKTGFGIFERGAMFFSKIPIYFWKIASFLPFFFFFVSFLYRSFSDYKRNFRFFFFFFRSFFVMDIQKKKNVRLDRCSTFYFQLFAIYTRGFLTNYKRGFTICQTFWLSLRYITCCKCRWHGVASCKYIYICINHA